ncbi:hypothetical protein ACOMHN_038452 [Nucella lapillus]
MYWIRNTCRKMFAAVGLLVLAGFAYIYQDINTANNKLLVEIRKQNSDLKRLLHGDNSLAVECSSDPSSDSDSIGSSSDRTFILQEAGSTLTDTDSYLTADTFQGSGTSTQARRVDLMAELRQLRCATPLKEMTGQMERWIDTGTYSPPASNGAVPNGSSPCSRYLLRPRRGRGSGSPTPATQVESPGSFARTVRQLERIADKNSRMVCAAVSSKTANK